MRIINVIFFWIHNDRSDVSIDDQSLLDQSFIDVPVIPLEPVPSDDNASRYDSDSSHSFAGSEAQIVSDNYSSSTESPPEPPDRPRRQRRLPAHLRSGDYIVGFKNK